MSRPLIFDVETQKIFQEVGGKTDKLRVSVVALYDFSTDSYHTFFETELPKMFSMFEKASSLIGFNINKFDLEVLKPYYVGNVYKFQTVDILEEIQKSLGRRIALDDLLKATLNVRKQGHGLLAVNYYKEGKLKELTDYCLSDVRLTKQLYDYILVNKKAYYFGPYGKVEIRLNLNQDSNPLSKSGVNLTLGI